MTTSHEEQLGPLVPASNFEVRLIRDSEINVRSCSFLVRGYGVWDKQAAGWVSLGRPAVTRQGDEVHLPYVRPRKKYAVEAVSQGLYAGYKVVPPHVVEPLGSRAAHLHSSEGRPNLIPLA